MSNFLHPDVLIIGGGIAGCAAAVSLKQKGLSVLVIEKDAEVRERFKGEYLQPFTVKKLRSLGFGELVDGPDTVKIRQLRFRDLDDHQNTLSETTIRYPVGSFAAVLPNKNLVAKIRKHTQQLLGENFIAGATAEPVNANAADFFKAPEFKVGKPNGLNLTIKPKWVIGCDGRQSTVRKWMGGKSAPAIGSATLGSSPEFIVGAELKGAHSFEEMYQVIRSHKRGTLAVFKLDENSRRCYWNTPSEKGMNGKKPWEDKLGRLLQDLSGFDTLGLQAEQGMHGLAGCSADTVWMGPAARGRFLLTGDAVAATTPFGGQGMTCVMHHVEALTNLLEKHSDHSEHAIQKLGIRYSQACHHWFRHVGLINFGLYYLFFARAKMYQSTTRHIMNRWQSRPEMADRVGRLFGGDDIDTPNIKELLHLWGIIPDLQLPLSKGFRRDEIA